MRTDILTDLRTRFGDKILLDPTDLEPLLGISKGQQANLRSAGRFPIPTQKVGGKVKVSIYNLADYLYSACQQAIAPALKENEGVKLSRTGKKARKGHLERNWYIDFMPIVFAVLHKYSLRLKFKVSEKSKANWIF